MHFLCPWLQYTTSYYIFLCYPLLKEDEMFTFSTSTFPKLINFKVKIWFAQPQLTVNPSSSHWISLLTINCDAFYMCGTQTCELYFIPWACSPVLLDILFRFPFSYRFSEFHICDPYSRLIFWCFHKWKKINTKKE